MGKLINKRRKKEGEAEGRQKSVMEEQEKIKKTEKKKGSKTGMTEPKK